MIPITKPYLSKTEASAAAETVLSGWVTQGPKVHEFENVFASYVGAKHACAVSNCTTALHVALLSVGVKPGDFVLTVSHSFIATANTIRSCQAEPLFIDIDPQTLNISPTELADFIQANCVYKNGQLSVKKPENFINTESPLKFLQKKFIGKVSAIVVVHQVGMPCDLKALLKIAKKFRLPVIEDAACAIGSEIALDGKSWEKIGKPHGDIACFSFHPRKVMTTGDGGMLTTNNAKLDEKFRLLRQHGMSVSDAVRHKSKTVVVEKYLCVGFNYRLTDIQAAIGIEQLKQLDRIVARRRELAQFYFNNLADVSWIELPYEPNYARTNWQSFVMKISKRAPLKRNALMQKMLEAGIASRPGIMNAHTEKPYINKRNHLPNSELARDNMVILPLFEALTEQQQRSIVIFLKSLQ